MSSTIIAGNDFCRKNCEQTILSQERTCYDEKENKIVTCKRSRSKALISDNVLRDDANKLCEVVCSSLTNQDICRFFGYIDKNKKKVDPQILQKYGIIIYRK